MVESMNVFRGSDPQCCAVPGCVGIRDSPRGRGGSTFAKTKQHCVFCERQPHGIGLILTVARLQKQATLCVLSKATEWKQTHIYRCIARKICSPLDREVAKDARGILSLGRYPNAISGVPREPRRFVYLTLPSSLRTLFEELLGDILSISRLC